MKHDILDTMWILFSLAGAIFQSITGALNKKNLQASPSSIHLIAFINYAVAGILLSLLLILTSGRFMPVIEDSQAFMRGILLTIPFNVVAVVCGYRALRLAEYSYLAPWTAVTSIFIILPSFLLLGEVPSLPALLGIVFVVAGAILIDWRSRKHINQSEEKERKDNRKAKIYIFIVGIYFSIAPIGMKVMILSSSPLFAAAIAHLAIAATFLIWILAFERKRVFAPFKTMHFRTATNFFSIAGITGIGYAIANGSINFASAIQDVSLVIAVKRVAPAFSFFIGYYLLHETRNAKRKIIATLIMVAGTVLITLYQ